MLFKCRLNMIKATFKVAFSVFCRISFLHPKITFRFCKVALLVLP